MMGHLKQVGVAEGIQFSSGGMIGNSLDSHRLVKFAGLLADQKQDAVINRLYRAYFEEEKNIADSQVLVSIAESAGLDGAKVREMLAGDHLLKETQDAVDQVHASGVSGVPFFIVGDKFAVSGAQDPSAFEAVFERALGAV
ncbi:thioredoxin-like protein [Chytriomyces cf. hyalinus JEL632]|nr:thioredoxin-like protein [Chytriomyces cf. hyalinus JEL632]